jgi:hypothetical protein
VINLEGFLRNDDVPTTPEPIGGRWQNRQLYPTGIGDVSLPTVLDCTLASVGVYQGEPAATIVVHSQAGGELPAAAVPGLANLAATGAKVAASMTAEGDFTVQHRLTDGIGVMSTSEEHARIHVTVAGPGGQERTQELDLGTSETVRLERIAPPSAARGGAV